MSGFKRGRKLALCITVPAILSCFGLTMINPVTCLSWGSKDTSCIGDTDWDNSRCSAHYFIIHKALGYLEEKGLLSDWPLDEYARHIDYGAYWADYPYDPVGLQCNWGDFYHGTCDSLHHYYSGWDVYLPAWGDFVAGDGGGLGAPDYAQNLYDLAIAFWPAGEPIPDIGELPRLDGGGSMRMPTSGAVFDYFVVGGHPFALDICAQLGCPEERTCTEYIWPGFVWPKPIENYRDWLCVDKDSPRPVPSESVRSALIYLGWAIHLVEDLSTPVHAANETGGNHQRFEEIADDLIADGEMSHLPVDPGTSKKYLFEEADPTGYPGSWNWEDYPVSPDFFHNHWTIVDFANEAAWRALEARESIYAQCPSVESDKWWIACWLPAADPQIQIDLDTSIKLVAGIIYKFFSRIGLSPDGFDREQSNDTPLTASPIGPGDHQLTIHAPLDQDYYEITIPEDFSQVHITGYYDRAQHNYWDLGFNVEYRDCEDPERPSVLAGFKRTGNYFVYEDEYVPAGRKYLIHVSPVDIYPLAFSYGMRVHVGKGDLPPDEYESNDSISDATDLSPVAWTSGVNIHSDSDVDYYMIDAAGWSVEAQISFSLTRGELELYLDGVKATESTLSSDGATKRLRITGCGQAPSYVKVQAKAPRNPNFYDIGLGKIPLDEGCPGYDPSEGMRGNGTFNYTAPICEPGQQPTPQTAIVREQMFVHLTDKSEQEVFWSVGAWLEYPDGRTAPLVVELRCEKGSQPSPAEVTMKILKPTLDGILWLGTGQGECHCSEDYEVLDSFSAAAELTNRYLYPICLPGHGTLEIEGHWSPDSDHDGMPDLVEFETDTSPTSDDTDSDGLLDSLEDRNQNGFLDEGETDPRSWDTDQDGISDGVERGLTSPQGNDTDPAIFVADDDPSTTTDPTRSDTDHDGFADGEEDANHNGRLDPGETSPLLRDARVQLHPIIYVDTDATGADDGSSWADAYNYLQDALANARAAARPVEIWVAEGVYKPDQGIGTTPADRSATFQLLDDVAVKGGYAGFGTPDSNARDIETYETILSGEIGTPQYDADNSYHVVVGSGTGVSALLDGFTITTGLADGHGFPHDFGGGILNISGRPTVINCTFSGNSAGQGGGIYNGNNSSPMLDNCTFSGNQGYHGAAMYNSDSDPILTGCTFWRNTATSGGAMYNNDSSLEVTNCTFTNNVSQENGGAMYNCNYSKITMINCMFNGNSAGQYGGSVHNKHSNLTLTNCTVSANSAVSHGGGLSGADTAYLTLTNCIVWGNVDSLGTGRSSQIYNTEGPPAINHCCLQGWSDGLGGVGNISNNPGFVDQDGFDNVVGTEDDDLRLSHGSPCVDSGDNAAVKPYIITDLDDHRRFADGDGDGYVIVDMGAYEYASVAFDHFDKDRGVSLTHCAPCATVASSTLTKRGGTLWAPEHDVNIRANGFIDLLDLAVMAENWLEDVQ